MAVQTTEEFKNGGATSYSITIEYLKASDIKVRIGGALQTYVASSPSSGEYTVSGTTVTLGAQAASGTGNVHIYRETDVNTAAATFAAGSSIRAADLNAIHDMGRFAAVEHRNKIITADVKDDAITNAKIADDQIDSEHYVAGSIDLEHMSANSVGTNQYVDNSIQHVHLQNDIIDSDNIQDDSINSEHYVDLSIDTQHIANENITTAKLANDAVTASKLADNAVVTDNIVNSNVTTAKIADGNVTRVKLEADIIDGTKLADNAVNSEHYTDGSIDREHLAADIVDGTKIADDSINSEHYVDGSIDHVHLANDIIDGDNIQDDVVNSEHIAAGALDNEHYAAGSITSDKLNAATVITASEQGAATTNDTSFLTSAAADARFFNISSGDTIKDGQTFPDNDTTIATTAAINDRIIDLVDDVGGFVPIANETSFPATNPDVNNGAGTIVSVSALSNAITTGSGVTTATIANGAGTGNTVTITGLTASTTYPAGFGFLVETTTTTHTYTFHRLLPKATEVETVAGSIGSVNTCATNIADINTVAADLNEGTSEIETVANSITNVNTVGNAIANVNTTATNIANVNTTASNITNVNNVGNNISNVNSVHNNASNINSAVSNASNINTVAGSISNVNTVGNAIANVNTTAGSITNVNTVASNVTDVNNFADLYQIASSNPSTDGGGNSLAEGDLYFNTSANRLKVYDGANWVDGVIASGGGAQTTGDTFTGDVKFNDNVKGLFGTGSDLEIFHDGTNSVIRDNGVGNLYLQHGTVSKFHISNTGAQVTGALSVTNGASVTGNITVSGNVDGRDVSADGTKLDGITSGAIADIVQDTSPQLGGDLQLNNRHILGGDSTSNNSFTNRVKLGTGEDLQLLHDGTNSVIFNQTGEFRIRGNDLKLQNYTSGENYLTCSSNGAVELYYDNAKKLETNSSGIYSFGNVSLSGNIHLADNGTLFAGSSNDLQIFHDGTDSVVRNLSGETRIQCANIFKVTNYQNTETYIKGSLNGNVELYHDNTKKLETTSTGIIVSGKAAFPDGTTSGVTIGNSGDLQLYHDGNHSHIKNNTGALSIKGSQVSFDSADGSEYMIKAVQNDAVELYHNGVKKLYTYVDGAKVEGDFVFKQANGTTKASWSGSANRINVKDSTKFTAGDGDDLQIYHDGSNSYINDSGTGNLYIKGDGTLFIQSAGGEDKLKATTNGSVEIYHDNSKKFETLSNGVKVTGNIELLDAGADIKLLNDNGKLLCGAGADLQIYHDGSHSRIHQDGTGYLIVQANNFLIKNEANNENLAHFINGGAVELYHNNSKKFETTSTGGTLTGTLLGNGLNFNTLEMNSDTQDSINFSATSTNDQRGIAFNGRTALSADHNDGYLRLNQGNEFSNGVFTQGDLRVDGAIKGNGATTIVNSSGQLLAARLTGALPALDGSALTGIQSTIANDCIYENEDVISSTVSTTSGKNAMSAGPIQITGTLTVADNTTYTIV